MGNVTPAGGPSEAAGRDDRGPIEDGRPSAERGMPTPAPIPDEFSALARKAEPDRRPTVRSSASAPPQPVFPANVAPAQLLSPDAASDIVRLDAQAFGAHQSVSTDDLAVIAQHGFFVGIRNDERELVAYASVIDRPCSYYDIAYVARLQPKQWYLEAMAASPSASGSGVGEQVLATVMHMAERNGVQEVRASLRPENHSSMHRLVNNHRFEIVGYHAHYFPESDGDRLVARRDLTQNRHYPIDSGTMITEHLDDRLHDNAVHTIGIPIGDEADTRTRRLLRRALDEGFIGVAFLRQRVKTAPSVLALVHPRRIDSQPAPAVQR